ncbi:MAG: hypothetical protein IKP54_05230 [Bacteroidales bacterium]|nr:hypothetical protein [Bacteroidales bacterium]
MKEIKYMALLLTASKKDEANNENSEKTAKTCFDRESLFWYDVLFPPY